MDDRERADALVRELDSTRRELKLLQADNDRLRLALTEIRKLVDGWQAKHSTTDAAILSIANRALVEPTERTITDGLGNVWPRFCGKCGGEMQVVRPGKAQCPRCG